ncbi:phage integrase N-terminal SAM-like domain-containing protein [[Clostridium] spiroforme]|nr:phage integrase N-terminal SAM-like domain-containing protein [Thomasclavelia spiroformis]
MNTKSINDKISQYPILNEVNLSLKLKNVSDRTILNYMDGIARFLDFISYDNHFEITSDMFRDYLIYLHSTPLKKNSINSNNSYIRFFFFAVLEKPINLYKVPMARFTRKEIDFLFDSQIHSLFSACSSDSRMDCIIKLGLCCGLRINEIIHLRVSDIFTRVLNRKI